MGITLTGIKRVKCSACKSVGTVEFATRDVPGLEAATEHGLLCTQCGRWTHSCYMSTALDAMLKEAMRAVGTPTAERLSTRYNQAFEDFQIVMAQREARAQEK